MWLSQMNQAASDQSANQDVYIPSSETQRDISLFQYLFNTSNCYTRFFRRSLSSSMGFFSSSPRSKPQRKHSEPTYETPEYDQQPVSHQYFQAKPSPYGPHFQKAPAQEHILNRRANGEKIAQGHPDLHNRAHSFHEPRQPHEFSIPYETRPMPWPAHVVAEYNEYHVFDKRKDARALEQNRTISEAKVKTVGKNTPYNPEYGKLYKDGISAAISGRIEANK